MIMFLNEDPIGLNQKSSLPAGLYRGEATVYVPTGDVASVVLAEFGPASGVEVTAVELLIHGTDGGLYYRNFLKLSDGMWRDSFGEKRFSLGELLPAEILEFKELQKIELPFQTVGASV
jgi:hypothetical protein